MSVKEYREKDVAGLEQELESLLREKFNLRMQQATQQLKQTHRLRDARRKVARIKTVLHEKAGQKS